MSYIKLIYKGGRVPMNKGEYSRVLLTTQDESIKRHINMMGTLSNKKYIWVDSSLLQKI